jgi:hypothetical protein
MQKSQLWTIHLHVIIFLVIYERYGTDRSIIAIPDEDNLVFLATFRMKDAVMAYVVRIKRAGALGLYPAA